MPKLTRATVPMCPECGAELKPPGTDHPTPSGFYYCYATSCNCRTRDPYIGHYAPDVAGVVAALRRAALAEPAHSALARLYDGWADELEGKR